MFFIIPHPQITVNSCYNCRKNQRQQGRGLFGTGCGGEVAGDILAADKSTDQRIKQKQRIGTGQRMEQRRWIRTDSGNGYVS